MPELKQYSSLEEKSQYFDSYTINTYIQLQEYLDHLESQYSLKKYIFRGSNESKYKLYNSAQRYYLQNELYIHDSSLQNQDTKNFHYHYSEFIKLLIESCKSWNSGTVIELLKAFNISTNNDMAYLSFMQHYGTPTPFLDFTYNPFVSIFFATEYANFNFSQNDIDSYVSIYSIDKRSTEASDKLSIRDDIFEKFAKGEVTYKDYASLMLPRIINSDIEVFRLINNTNIINQRGLFFFNGDYLNPLENAYLEITKNITRFHNGVYMSENRPEKITCHNIHKSLISHLKSFINAKGITGSYIYPNFNIMRIGVQDDTVELLIKSS